MVFINNFYDARLHQNLTTGIHPSFGPGPAHLLKKEFSIFEPTLALNSNPKEQFDVLLHALSEAEGEEVSARQAFVVQP